MFKFIERIKQKKANKRMAQSIINFHRSGTATTVIENEKQRRITEIVQAEKEGVFAHYEKRVCPSCGGEMVKVMYGYPSEIMFEKARRGQIILGGDILRGDPVKMKCKTCGHKIISEGKPQD